MQPGRYRLSRDLLGIGGDFTLTGADGATAMTFDGMLRFAAVFTAFDADGRALFTGREHVLDLDQRFEFEHDGVVLATMQREWVGAMQLIGEQPFRYVVTCRNGERLQTHGDVLTRFSVRRNATTVARVERDGHHCDVDLDDATDGAFVMCVVVAIARLNRPTRTGTSD